jgi:hypothetical protein
MIGKMDMTWLSAGDEVSMTELGIFRYDHKAKEEEEKKG